MCILPFRTHTWCHINNNLICFTFQLSHPGDVCCLATSSWITPPLPTPGNFARWSNTAESLRRAAASGRLERTKCSARFSTSREVLTSFTYTCANWWTWIYIGLVKFETTIREMHGDKNHEVWHKIDVNFRLVQVLVVPPFVQCKSSPRHVGSIRSCQLRCHAEDFSHGLLRIDKKNRFSGVLGIKVGFTESSLRRSFDHF